MRVCILVTIRLPLMPDSMALTTLVTLSTKLLPVLWAATVGAFRWTLEARKVEWSLNGITPPPMATLVDINVPLVIPLAKLGHPSCRLISTERPLALLEMTAKLWLTKVRVRIVVPPPIRPVHLPYLGRRTLLKVMVPVVTIRLSGLFRTLGNMVELSNRDTTPTLFPGAPPF